MNDVRFWLYRAFVTKLRRPLRATPSLTAWHLPTVQGTLKIALAWRQSSVSGLLVSSTKHLC